MTSYIKILQKLEAFSNAHLQIQKFAGEFREQMPNFSTMDERYPLVFVSPVSDVEDLNTNLFTLEIYCVDIIQKDRANLNTIVSDCHLILKDLFIYYRDDNDADLDVVGTASISFVNNFDLDYVAGAVMTITFEVAGYGSCEIPMNPITPTPNVCDPATYEITNSLANVLYSGTIPSGGTLNQEIQDSTYTVEYLNGTPIESGTIPAEGSVVVQVPNPADATYTITDDSSNVLYSGTIPSGGNLNQVIQDSTVNILNSLSPTPFQVINVNAEASTSYLVPDSAAELRTSTGSLIGITIVPANSSVSITAPDTTIEVNGVSEGSVVAGSTVDIQLSDSGGMVTPTSVTQIGNDFQIVLPDAPPSVTRSTATLMKTGQTTSYRTGDDGDIEAGRATDFLTLDAAPVHNDGSATINTTTNRFTDTLGGSTYADDIVLDWSTWNGSTLLGWYRVPSGSNASWNTCIDNALATSIGTFTTGWRLPNDLEIHSIIDRGVVTYFNYAPFNLSGTVVYWTSTTTVNTTTNAFAFSISSGGIVSNPKTNLFRYMPCRTFSLSTLNVLS